MEGVVHEEDNASWKKCTFLTDVLCATVRKGIDLAALPRRHLVLSKFMKHPCVVKGKAFFLAGFLFAPSFSGSKGV